MAQLQFFTTSFLSVLIGALPFIVVAVFASAFLEVFVSRETLVRWIPKNPVLGALLAPLAGAVIPMCECGNVPVVRRLILKGAPLPAALSFMLANPILNPLVILSTSLAFPFAPHMVWWRIGLGYVIAVIAAVTVGVLVRRPEIIMVRPAAGGSDTACACGYEHAEDGGHGCGHDHAGHDHAGHDHAREPLSRKIYRMFSHASDEFFSVGRYFILGAFVAGLAQSLISRPVLESVGRGPIVSVLVMVVFAYVICICSEADAFVAATFASTFSPGALLAFMVFGPMADLKNTLMQLSVFRRRFVVTFNLMLAALNLAAGILVNLYLL